MERLASALPQRPSRPLRILDLASGSGASFRVLAPVIAVDQVWTLTDHDIGLLSAHAGDTARWKTQARVIDLACHLDELDFAAFDGITTSAFLDLVSQQWLERFAAKLIADQRPLLAMLNVDGRRDWNPVLTEDVAVLAAFERHQSSNKGFGTALGAAATFRLAELLKTSSYAVTLARSDWHIGPDAHAMLWLLLNDTLRAACEACPEAAETFALWGDARRRQLKQGALSLQIGHIDLLALPPSAGGVA